MNYKAFLLVQKELKVTFEPCLNLLFFSPLTTLRTFKLNQWQNQLFWH